MKMNGLKNLTSPHKNVDSLVLAFNDLETSELTTLYKQGLTNGLKADEMAILNNKQCLEIEPNLNAQVMAGLLCTSSHIVDPVCLTVKFERGIINDHILFVIPTIYGKGVIVAPMLDGHVLIGPSAEDGIAKEDTRLITIEQFEAIGVIAKRMIPSLRVEKTCSVLVVLVPFVWKPMIFGLLLLAKTNGLFMWLVFLPLV